MIAMRHSTFLLTLSSVLAAQTPPTLGPFSTMSHSVSLIPGQTSVVASPSLVRVKPGGHQVGVLPVEAAPAEIGQPDWRAQAILQGATNINNIDIDGISTANDFLPISVNGWLVPPAGSWTGMTFSVSSASMGAPDSWIRVRYNQLINTDRLGGDLFGYYFPGSSILPTSLIDQVTLEQPADVIDISSPPASVFPEMDGHDMFIPMLLGNPTTTTELLRQLGTVYFTVSTACLGSVPDAWFRPGKKSGATILRRNWDATTGVWGPVVEARTFESLGLVQSDDIDALAVDGPRSKLLFSLRATSLTVSQLLTAGLTSGLPVSLKTNTGQDVWPRLRLRNDDNIDAICVFDPSLASRFSGVPVAVPGAHPNLGLSAARTYDRAKKLDELVMQLTGWVRNQVAGTVIFTVLVNGVVVSNSSVTRRPGQRTVELRIPMAPGHDGIVEVRAAFEGSDGSGGTTYAVQLTWM